MKKSAIIGLAVMGLTAGAFAQGVINLDDSSISPGVELGSSFYTGTYGISVWELNSTTVPGGINNAATSAAAVAALTSNGFKNEGGYYNQSMTGGVFSLNGFTMADVSPAGSTVTVALEIWNDGSIGGPGATTKDAGVIAFVNATSTPTGNPPPTPPNLDGWNTLNQNLVMTTYAVPEPSVFALSSIGAAALMLIRRKK